MDAIASCYRAAIDLDSNSSLSAAEAAACVAKFLDANAGRLLKVKGDKAITERSFKQAIGLIPNPDNHDGKVWLKSKVLQESVFSPGTFESVVKKLGDSDVIVLSSSGLASRQQRIPGLNIKEYFYVIDAEKLRALHRGKSGS